MSIEYKFECEYIERSMEEIESKLNIDNALILEFGNRKDKEGIGSTSLIKVNNKICNKYKFEERSSNNIYFLFDNEFKCQYVGKKANKKGINERLKLHLLTNNKYRYDFNIKKWNIKNNGTSSCIMKVCDYLDKQEMNKKIVYVITCNIEPEYMVESMEVYFIKKFKQDGAMNWLKRQ